MLSWTRCGFMTCLLFVTVPVAADHSGSHATPCDAADSVGGGMSGVSPGPVGPPDSLGWDVGSGQCNGSFTLFSDPMFPGGGIELGLRAEERRIGQVARLAGDNYEVQTGNDANAPPATNRAWWNFQFSVATDAVSDLDALTLQIRTDASSNLPAAPSFDLLAFRGGLDARSNQPNATSTWSDLYQASQNPEFGWFMTASDTDANSTGAFNYDEEGAWRFRITATEGVEEAAVEICIHTPNAECLYPVVGVAKQMTPLDPMLPATIQIDYFFENFGGDTLLDPSVVDDLTAVFGVHGIDWTFTSISSIPAGFAEGTFDGHGNNQLVAASQSLAGGATASISVVIELLTVAAADMSGDFCNQVTLEGEDSLGVSYSDLSVSGSNPDPDDDDDPVEESFACFNRTSVPVTLQRFSIE